MNTPAELFDQVIDLIGNVIVSFNKNSFPDETFSKILILKQFIQKNLGFLQSTEYSTQQLKDAFIELEQVISAYQIASRSPESPICLAIQRKDFVRARDLFKQLIGPRFIESLSDDNPLSPSKIWKKSYTKLIKIIGYG